MAKRITSEDLTLNLILNADKMKQGTATAILELDKLDREVHELNNKLFQLNLAKTKLDKTSKTYAKDLKALNLQINKTKREIEMKEAAMKQLRMEAGRAGMTLNQLNAHLRKLKIDLHNSVDPTVMKRLRNEIRLTELQMERMRTGMSRSAQAWRHMGEMANKYGTIMGWVVITLVGIGTAINRTVRNFRELDKEFSNVMKTTNLTREEMMRLKRDFDQLNTTEGKTPTRTMELLEIARIAGRLGVRGVEDIRDFTLAVDKLYVALGEDLEGTIEEVAEKVGKLVNVFKLTDKMPLNEALLRAGSLINELGKSSAANAETILNYTARLGGVGSMANFTMDQLAGLGATLDALNVPAERGSTAVVKLITGLGTQVEKFSRILGMSAEDYAEWVKRDVNGVLIAMLKATGSQQDSIVEVVQGMGDMEVSGVRVAEAYGKLVQNIDLLVEQQDIAARAFASSASVMNEFYIMSQDYDSLMALQGKRIKSLADDYSKAMAPAMFKAYKGIIDLLYALRDLFLWVERNIHIVGGLTAAYGFLKATQIALWIQKVYTAIAFEIGYRRLLLIELWKNNAALVAMRGAYAAAGGGIKGATAALKSFTTALYTNPWTAAVAVVLALASAFLLTRKRTDEVKKAMGDFSTEIRTQTGAMKNLFEAAKKTEEKSAERARAIKAINEMYGQYLPKLLTEADSVTAIGDAYDYANKKLTEQIALKFKNDRYNEIIQKAQEERVKKQERMLGYLKTSQGPGAYGQVMFETDEVVTRLAKMSDKTAINITVSKFLEKWGLENQASRKAFLDLIALRKDEIKIQEDLDKTIEGYLDAAGIKGGLKGLGSGDGTEFEPMSDADFEKEKAALKLAYDEERLMLMKRYKDKDELRKAELKAEEKHLQEMLKLTEKKWTTYKPAFWQDDVDKLTEEEKKKIITLEGGMPAVPILLGGEQEILDARLALAENMQRQREAGIKAEKESSKTLIDIEKLRYEAISDERKKDIAEEEYRHAKQKKEYEESAEEKTIIDEAVALEKQKHVNNLTDIELKYLDKQLADTNVTYAQKIVLLEAELQNELITLEQYNARKLQLESDYNTDMLAFKRRYGILVEETLEAEMEMYKNSEYYAQLSEEEKQKGIQYIIDKYQQKRERQFKTNIEKELDAIKASFNDLQSEAFEQGMSVLSIWQDVGAGIGSAFAGLFDETQDGFASFAKTILLMAIEVAANMARMQYPAILAKALAKYALVPGGQAIALKETAVKVGLIEAAIGLAKGLVSTINTKKKETTTKTKQYARGKYPVIGEDDGRTYNAEWVGRPKTGVYKNPSLGLFAEKPEMVIDYPTLRNIQINSPGLIQAIMAHRNGFTPQGRGNVKQYADGDYRAGSGTFNGVTSSDPELKEFLQQNLTMMKEFKNMKVVVAVETIEKEREKYIQVKQTSGL